MGLLHCGGVLFGLRDTPSIRPTPRTDHVCIGGPAKGSTMISSLREYFACHFCWCPVLGPHEQGFLCPSCGAVWSSGLDLVKNSSLKVYLRSIQTLADWYEYGDVRNLVATLGLGDSSTTEQWLLALNHLQIARRDFRTIVQGTHPRNIVEMPSYCPPESKRSAPGVFGGHGSYLRSTPSPFSSLSDDA